MVRSREITVTVKAKEEMPPINLSTILTVGSLLGAVLLVAVSVKS